MASELLTPIVEVGEVRTDKEGMVCFDSTDQFLLCFQTRKATHLLSLISDLPGQVAPASCPVNPLRTR